MLREVVKDNKILSTRRREINVFLKEQHCFYMKFYLMKANGKSKWANSYFTKKASCFPDNFLNSDF